MGNISKHTETRKKMDTVPILDKPPAGTSLPLEAIAHILADLKQQIDLRNTMA